MNLSTARNTKKNIWLYIAIPIAIFSALVESNRLDLPALETIQLVLGATGVIILVIQFLLYSNHAGSDEPSKVSISYFFYTTTSRIGLIFVALFALIEVFLQWS